MAKKLKADICVIGAGSGGLSVAAGAVQMGASVILIEKGKMGGDCLNYGCVPSKALLAASHMAQSHKKSSRFGVAYPDPDIDFSSVRAHVQSVISAIEPHDSVARFEGLGVTVIQGEARFTSPKEVEVNGEKVTAKYFVIATGSSPAIPSIPGFADSPYFTNETIFENAEKPDHLIVVGGGPVGCEMAQAHAHLGCQVTLITQGNMLGKDDPEAVAILRDQFEKDGIALHEGTAIKAVKNAEGKITLSVEHAGESLTLSGSHLLIATGRKPNLDGLGLDAAEVAFSAKGIEVDARLRTSNKRIFAIGDVTGGYQFTHMAGYDAGIVIRNALFKLPAKVDHKAVPWVTYSYPELAQVGMSALSADPAKITVLKWPFGENDRALAEGETAGFIKAFVDQKGRILGATIVGVGAGEMLAPWALAIGKGLKVGDMAGVILPYPTRSEISKRVAGSYFTPKLFSRKIKLLVSFLMKFS